MSAQMRLFLLPIGSVVWFFWPCTETLAYADHVFVIIINYIFLYRYYFHNEV